MRLALIIGSVAGLVSLAFSFLIWKLSHRYRLMPAIRARDVHSNPTPRLGGVAMFLGIAAGLGVASQIPEFGLVFSDPWRIWSIVTAAFIIVVVGVIDDLWDIDWTIKLAAQIIAAGVLAYGGIQLFTLPVGGITILSPSLSLALTVFAIVLVMNAINFIDGLDGLVAGVALIGTATFFLYTRFIVDITGRNDYFNLASLITVVLAGACAGFLVLNWHPAKLFMGDSGALLVGLLMATSAIAVTGQIDPGLVESQQIGRSDIVPAFIPIVLPIALIVVPLLDFGLAVLRRLRAGKSPFSADRLHLHHRLLDMGHSHFHAVLVFYAWTIVVAVGCLLPLFFHWGWALAFIAVGLAVSTWVTMRPLVRRKREREAALASGATDVMVSIPITELPGDHTGPIALQLAPRADVDVDADENENDRGGDRAAPRAPRPGSSRRETRS